MPEQILRCIVVDDEPPAVRLIADYVKRTPGLECVLASSDVLEALQAVQAGKADLVFLDIQMPELTGIQFMKIVKNNCGIIVTSAYSEYAIEGYEYNVIDYLLKPVTFDRFIIAVEKAKHRLASSVQQTTADVDHIFLKINNRLQRVNCADIIYIEGLRDYIAIHTSTQKLLSLESLRNIITMLPGSQFIRTHKSYIINKGKVVFVEKNIVSLGAVELPVGETYREAFMHKMKL
ncbi:MAG: LytTR family DNA-binding domain-containing protein [Flavitalea sp.]